MVKRTTVTVPNNGFVVVRFLANNPGLWLFHCHVFSHLVEGQAVLFDVTDQGVPAVPSNFPTCPINHGDALLDLVPLSSIGTEAIIEPGSSAEENPPAVIEQPFNGAIFAMILIDISQWFFRLFQTFLF